MRKFQLIAVSFLLFVCVGCPTNEPELRPVVEDTGEKSDLQPAELLSSLHMADPRATVQLLSGFHTLEQGAWRWTEREFSVLIKPPPLVSDQPLELELKFTLPEVSIDRLNSVTLSATVNGTSVGSETFAKAGDYVFSRPIPAQAITAEPAEVQFELDKALPPGDPDTRELGLVAVSVALK